MRITSDGYLAVAGPECKSRLTRYYAHEIAEFTYLVTKIQETLAAFYAQRTEAEEKSARAFAFSLMYKAANTLMAAFELALSGYELEPPILFRTALEGCAAGWDIVSNEKSFKVWMSDKKFESTSSITRLKRIDETYGKIWGLLSTTKVHTTKENCCPALFESPKGPVFQLYGFIPEGMEERRRHVIESSVMAAHACLQLTEIAFYPFITHPETVAVSTAGFVTPTVTERHARFIKSYDENARRHREENARRHREGYKTAPR